MHTQLERTLPAREAYRHLYTQMEKAKGAPPKVGTSNSWLARERKRNIRVGANKAAGQTHSFHPIHTA
jgi:hypothetical protein